MKQQSETSTRKESLETVESTTNSQDDAVPNQKKIFKESRNYPKNRKARSVYATPEEKIAAKKEQNRLGI